MFTEGSSYDLKGRKVSRHHRMSHYTKVSFLYYASNPLHVLKRSVVSFNIVIVSVDNIQNFKKCYNPHQCI